MAPTIQDDSLELERIFSVDREIVYRAWSDPAAVGSWMGPSDDLDIEVHHWDFRPGGRYRIEMKREGAPPHIVGGLFDVLEPPTSLVFSWAWKNEPEQVTRVTVALDSVEGGTKLTLRHEDFESDEARASHEKGWLGTFERLTRHLVGQGT